MVLRALITGGAGFIGSHLADELLAKGMHVRVLDSLVAQVHGSEQRPKHLHRDVEFVHGDVRDSASVRRSLEQVDVVFHLAAMVGVGQSMYEMVTYTDVNDRGTAVLLEALAQRPVRRLVVASSMSVYGEGLYRDVHGNQVESAVRHPQQLARGDWEPRGTRGETLVPQPTPEAKVPCLQSVYALGKFNQERMCLMVGKAYEIPTVALRFFNVYGTRQSLSNPYTGVLAIFASRLLNRKNPLLFEDGAQQRDFVHVRDVVQACMRAMESDGAVGRVFNVASGKPRTVMDVAAQLNAALGASCEPVVTNQYRVGDIRHCIADIRAAQQTLGYVPQVSFTQGLRELCGWLESQVAIDRFDDMRGELENRGLAV